MRSPECSRVNELQQQITALQADITALAEDRRWIVRTLASLAVELELRPG